MHLCCIYSLWVSVYGVSIIVCRWFGGQQLEVSHWDGLQNFAVEETSQERGERLAKWEQFLAEDENKEVREPLDFF